MLILQFMTADASTFVRPKRTNIIDEIDHLAPAGHFTSRVVCCLGGVAGAFYDLFRLCPLYEGDFNEL